LDNKFEYLQVDKYICFNYSEFHRTKMINEMVRQSDTDIVVICDADVIIPEEQYHQSIELILQGSDVVYPYNKFIKLNKYQSNELRNNTYILYDLQGIDSKGGMIFFNKESYINGGMENEKFMVWGYEDYERYSRFKKLGYKIEIIPGNIYHLYHHKGLNSIPLNEHYNDNKIEFEKVNSMTKEELKEYVSTW
jgi:hypothetical protein